MYDQTGTSKLEPDIIDGISGCLVLCVLVALRCFSCVPSPHGIVLNIGPRALNLTPCSPRVTNVLSNAQMHSSRCGLSCVISGTFMTRNMTWIHCDCCIGHRTGMHINLHSACAHRPSLKFLVFRLLRVLCSNFRVTSTRIFPHPFPCHSC